MRDKATIHDLKIWPPYFEAIKNGTKKFEYRIFDRPFKVGDLLRLREFNPKNGEYTGLETTVRITYILSVFNETKTRVAVLSIEPIRSSNAMDEALNSGLGVYRP
jgi:ASC-1-like (ASCH) protein